MGYAWAVVVPVKRLTAAKTRLRGAVPDIPHGSLALALALDTVTAAMKAANVYEVLVVTDEPAAREAVAALGARWVPDVPDAGLNPALAHGAAQATAGLAVAALSADLPALRPDDLDGALDAAARYRRAFVTDTAGTGTVLLTAAPGVDLAPRFGRASAEAHRLAGAVGLTGPVAPAGAVDLAGPVAPADAVGPAGAVGLAGGWASLRRDVDTAADLRAAAALGLGPHTAALLPAGFGGGH